VKRKTFSCGSPPYKVEAQVTLIGSDLLVALYGGSKPHIGSVVVALPRPSLKDKKQMSSTSSVYNFLGHKDYVIAQRVAELLSSRLNKNVVVVAGIHIDRISKKGIAKVIENCDKLSQKICQNLVLVNHL
jgi:hypothetical protein